MAPPTRSQDARRVPWTAAFFAVLLCAFCTSASQPARALLDETAGCLLDPTSNKCSVNPLLVSSLPAPKTRVERLLAHYAALAYTCSQHKAEPECSGDAQHFCEYRPDKLAGISFCGMSPVAVVEHGAEALMCEDSRTLQHFRCLLAPDCATTPGCVSTADKCTAEFESKLTAPEIEEWDRTLQKGEAAAWGTCKGARLFYHLFAGCVRLGQQECLNKDDKCAWAARGGGAGGVCAPHLYRVERSLMKEKDDDFAKGYYTAYKVCHSAPTPECVSDVKFTANPDALLPFMTLTAVLDAPRASPVSGNSSIPANVTMHKHLNPEGSTKHHHKHHHKHHKHHKHDLAAARDAPSGGAIAVLVLATIAAMAVVAAAAYIAYNHIRNPRISKYHPVLSADGTELGATAAGAHKA